MYLVFINIRISTTINLLIRIESYSCVAHVSEFRCNSPSMVLIEAVGDSRFDEYERIINKLPTKKKKIQEQLKIAEVDNNHIKIKSISLPIHI